MASWTTVYSSHCSLTLRLSPINGNQRYHRARPAWSLKLAAPAPVASHRLLSRSSPLVTVVPRASAEGLPAELLEDSKFVPINDDDPQFGPPALMLMGFTSEEVSKVQELLRNMDGDFLKILLCTEEMIKGTLWDAMHTSQSDLSKVKVAQGVPRICFLSGLTGEEIMMFVQAFPDANLESAVFAALVPNNAHKSVEELIEEIMGDHQRLTKKS